MGGWRPSRGCLAAILDRRCGGCAWVWFYVFAVVGVRICMLVSICVLLLFFVLQIQPWCVVGAWAVFRCVYKLLVVSWLFLQFIPVLVTIHILTCSSCRVFDFASPVLFWVPPYWWQIHLVCFYNFLQRSIPRQRLIRTRSNAKSNYVCQKPGIH